jgi:cholesterol oxidase
MEARDKQFDFDFIVIGSGFGGSVSAHRLTEKGYRVTVIEMGRRWSPDNLPHTSWSIHRWFWRPKLGLRGFFNMRFFRHVTILHGCAVGGGSITYACTLLSSPEKVWETGSWTGLANWKAEMPGHYETASRMLGFTKPGVIPRLRRCPWIRINSLSPISQACSTSARRAPFHTISLG